ncbi:hypothetical protein MCOR29_008341 [Pyricularia oryzae]|uniref:Uncharacterized protein n=1 Tax=Pyricularia grisea TaxID=148305 RepID=A0ABQ8NMY3_PYRGI|nr:hypothetical protein MCOR01_010625 [Pyricularia oryzae]KAI6299592.1 hypothetical protein MCOR33_004500 [Pyricularia grisea]KAI6281222.1 hypothetical protein MCOR26_003413 [Pyricularia oryzae]KAI6311243.1 hypothetical protein MCOR29_008341 [Pyricularia oryzae]KAI6317949.1 hypothetical protein MCOR34_003843 [Pyricularia oryzae]
MWAWQTQIRLIALHSQQVIWSGFGVLGDFRLIPSLLRLPFWDNTVDPSKSTPSAAYCFLVTSASPPGTGTTQILRNPDATKHRQSKGVNKAGRTPPTTGSALCLPLHFFLGTTNPLSPDTTMSL